MPWIDGIDFDDEEPYDADTTTGLAQLNEKHPGLVSGLNLQCYAGGEGNEPGPWIEAIEAKMGLGFDAKSFVRPGHY